MLPITKWEPFKEIERFFDEDFWPSLPKISWDLATDVYRKGGKVFVEINLPGVDPNKIDISIEDNYLKVKGSREEKKETKKGDYYRKEIKRGSFERVVLLPVEVKKDKAKAEYKGGVLKVVIPEKSPKMGKTKKVKVEVKEEKAKSVGEKSRK